MKNMSKSICDKVIRALKQAESHNRNLMVKPEVILWPDKEKQWLEVISILQESIPQLLVYGNYEPTKKQGPAIWLKCMVARMLSEANWDSDTVPIIYMPGVAKSDLRNVETAILSFQPLLEYQYTGTIFLQDNGLEWDIMTFLEDPDNGLGIKASKDDATKAALKKVLPNIFQDSEVLANKTIIDANYLNSRIYHDLEQSILKWMCKGDSYLQVIEENKRDLFVDLCKSQYEFEPDYKNIKAIAEKLGSQKNSWKHIWEMYAAAPHKYTEVEELLRKAKPDDLGEGIFALPEESWPQINEQKEEALAKELTKAGKQDRGEAIKLLANLEKENSVRRNWVWYELGEAPLTDALQYLNQMAIYTSETYSSSTIEEIKIYYITSGYKIDQNMRKSLAAVKTEKDKKCVKAIIKLIYQPWLESITNKFQKLTEADARIFTLQTAVPESEDFVLFVDALRYELAEELKEVLVKHKMNVTIKAGWSAIPSVTATAKPNVSPIATEISIKSKIEEFIPEFENGNKVSTDKFREELEKKNFKYAGTADELQNEGKYWQEIGNIDKIGHSEQADLVKRVDDFFAQVKEIIDVCFEKGIKRIKIVTDHGWLLLPGGLPKTKINAGLTETRWGRCALIKEGASTDLLHLPWRWNPSVFIAYAPGISFFKANVEYAHGGISIQECLVPTMIVEAQKIVNVDCSIKKHRWVNLKCEIQTEGALDGYTVDIRTKYNDSSTSIVLSTHKTVKNNAAVLMVDDTSEAKAANIVLLDENEIILDKKPTTVGG